MMVIPATYFYLSIQAQYGDGDKLYMPYNFRFGCLSGDGSGVGIGSGGGDGIGGDGIGYGAANGFHWKWNL